MHEAFRSEAILTMALPISILTPHVTESTDGSARKYTNDANQETAMNNRLNVTLL
jgi:hypothetical protein